MIQLNHHQISIFLHDTMQAMVISGVRLEFILVNPGVPEGLVLSPCIFLVYFNDLYAGVSSLAHFFADGAIFYILFFLITKGNADV